MSRRDLTHGFTLIELLTIVALLAIFASIAVPSFQRMVENNRLQSTVSEFHRALQGARADAVTLRTAMTACPTQQEGWEIRQDDNCNGNGEVRWRVQIPPSVALETQASAVTFRPNGTATAASLEFNSHLGNRKYTIVAAPSGRVSTSSEDAAEDNSP